MGAITSMGSLDTPSDAVSLLTDTVSVSVGILAEWVAGDATGILSVMLVTFWILLPQYWQIVVAFAANHVNDSSSKTRVPHRLQNLLLAMSFAPHFRQNRICPLSPAVPVSPS